MALALVKYEDLFSLLVVTERCKRGLTPLGIVRPLLI
jgi:hypothetical protein